MITKLELDMKTEPGTADRERSRRLKSLIEWAGRIEALSFTESLSDGNQIPFGSIGSYPTDCAMLDHGQTHDRSM